MTETDSQKVKNFTQNVEKVTILALLDICENREFFSNNLTLGIYYYIWLLSPEENKVHDSYCCTFCQNLLKIRDIENLVKHCDKTWGKEDLRRIISNLLQLTNKSSDSFSINLEKFSKLEFPIDELAVDKILETTRLCLRQDKLARKQFFIENGEVNWG